MPTAERTNGSLRVLHWNICHGGGTRRTPAIALELIERAPDVIVLSEFRTGTGGQLAGVLYDHGWTHILTSSPTPGVNGLLVASRTPLCPGATPPERDSARWLDVRVPAVSLRLTAVHIPHAARGDHGQIARKAAIWAALNQIAARNQDCLHLIVGDLNTPRPGIDETGSTTVLAHELGRLVSLGYRDPVHDLAGRESGHGTWFSRTGRGFRLDQALVSEGLRDRVRAVNHLDGFRRSELSDHAAIEVELTLYTRFSEHGNLTTGDFPRKNRAKLACESE